MDPRCTDYSAPATSPGGFARLATPTRVPANDLLGSDSARETLLSFPSVTDSSPSEWEVGDEERVSQHMKGKKGKTIERVKSPKRYPRGSVDDDEEESEILFRKGTISSEGDKERSGTSPPEVSGIRLVSTNKRSFF